MAWASSSVSYDATWTVHGRARRSAGRFGVGRVALRPVERGGLVGTTSPDARVFTVVGLATVIRGGEGPAREPVSLTANRDPPV